LEDYALAAPRVRENIALTCQKVATPINIGRPHTRPNTFLTNLKLFPSTPMSDLDTRIAEERAKHSCLKRLDQFMYCMCKEALRIARCASATSLVDHLVVLLQRSRTRRRRTSATPHTPIVPRCSLAGKRVYDPNSRSRRRPRRCFALSSTTLHLATTSFDSSQCMPQKREPVTGWSPRLTEIRAIAVPVRYAHSPLSTLSSI